MIPIFSVVVVTVLACLTPIQYYGVQAGTVRDFLKLAVTPKPNQEEPADNITVPHPVIVSCSHLIRGRRSANGELVELNPAKSEELDTISPEKKDITILDPRVPDKLTEATSTNHSKRQKRTFWPFTGLFGYDYPPPPIYGPMMPPFGGVGFGPMMPPPPPPFGFGLGFGFGR